MTIMVDRAISLIQPWATLMAIGAKRIETRGWKTSHVGWIAIHASKSFPIDCRELCLREPFTECLADAGVRSLADLPRGHVIAVTYLYSCQRTEALRINPETSEREFAFGNYDDGRYGFITANVRQLREPIAMRGALSIWKMPRTITEADLL